MADFRINVVVDPSAASRGTRRVERDLNRVSRTADRLRNTLARTFAVLGLGAGLVGGIRLLADFSQEMSTVRAITGATEAQFRQLSDTAQDLGRTTRFSATQAAEGMVFLARAGFTAEQALETVDDTLQLAQAGALGLGRAADIASNVLTGFRLETDQAARVVDVLALAANSANTDVDQLGQALKFVAPVAAGVGVSLEETTAAIGALSNAGLQASLAGTGLRRVISELESPASRTRDILQGLGVSAEEVRISQVGLTAALRRLAQAGVDTGTALELFGDRGGPAFEVLRSSLPDVENLTGRLQEAEGTAARIARTMDDNLNGALLSVRSAFEGLVLAVGEQGATGALTGFLRSLATGIRALAENADVLVNVIQALSISLGVRFARQAVPAAIAGVNRLTAAIAANPIGALATALTVGISLLVAFRNELKLTEDGVATLGDFFAELLEQGREAFQGLVTNLGVLADEVDRVLGTTFGDIELSFRDVFLAIAAIVDAGVGIFVGFFNAVRALFVGLPEAVASGVITALNALLDLFENAFDGIRALGATIGQFFSRIGFAIVSNIRTLAQASRALFSGQVELAADLTAEAGEVLANNLLGAFTQTPQALRGNVRRFANERLLPEIENQFEGAGERLGEGILEGIQSGAEVRGAQDFILGVIEGAEDRANQRQLDRFKKAQEDRANEAARVAAGAQDKVNRALENVPPPNVPEVMGLARVLQELEQETRLLGLTSREREVANELLRIENELKKEGVALSEAQREDLETRLRGLQSLNEQARILEELRGPQEDLIARQEAANALFESGRITLEEFNQIMRDTAVAAAEAGNSIADGLTVGFARVEDRLNDLASIATDTLTGAFQGLEDAFVSFVTTGEANFSQLVDSIIADVVRLLARQAIGAIFNLVSGGVGGGVGSLLGGIFGRQAGGPVDPSRPFIVGEQGPEIFRPSTAGNIIPAGETAVMLGGGTTNVNVAPPNVNVNVEVDRDGNVTISEQIESREGEQAVLNVIQRNPRQVRSLTS